MLKEILHTVKGAIDDHVLSAVLKCIYINGDRIQTTNGNLTIDAYGTDFGFSCLVPAEKFLKAIGNAPEDLKFILNEKNLLIKRGKLKVTIATLPLESFPLVNDFSGESEGFNDSLLPAFTLLKPFISTNSAQPWANSILVTDGFAYATNNVIIVRTPLVMNHRVIFPRILIEEMLRLKIQPDSILINPLALSILYTSATPKFRLRASTNVGQWAISAVKMFDKEPAFSQDASLPMMPFDLAEAVKSLKPFFPDSTYPIVHMTPQTVSTDQGYYYADVDFSTQPYPNLPSTSRFRFESLSLMLSVASSADFTKFPSPVPFKGERLEGFIVGIPH